MFLEIFPMSVLKLKRTPMHYRAKVFSSAKIIINNPINNQYRYPCRKWNKAMNCTFSVVSNCCPKKDIEKNMHTTYANLIDFDSNKTRICRQQQYRYLSVMRNQSDNAKSSDIDSKVSDKEQLSEESNEAYMNTCIDPNLNVFEKKEHNQVSEIRSIPNMITIGRMISAPILIMALYGDMKNVVFYGIMIAGFTDWLDGYIAKTYNMKTILGAFLDPVADKIIIGCIATGLTLKGLIPLQLACLIIARDVGILGTGLYLRYVEKTKDENFFDTSLISFNIEPSLLSKVNTSMQFVCLSSALYVYAVEASPTALSVYMTNHFLNPLFYATACTTILSGIGYLDGSGMVKIKERTITLANKNKQRALDIASKNKDKAIKMAEKIKRKSEEYTQK